MICPPESFTALEPQSFCQEKVAIFPVTHEWYQLQLTALTRVHISLLAEYFPWCMHPFQSFFSVLHIVTCKGFIINESNYAYSYFKQRHWFNEPCRFMNSRTWTNSTGCVSPVHFPWHINYKTMSDYLTAQHCKMTAEDFCFNFQDHLKHQESRKFKSLSSTTHILSGIS